MRVSFFCQYSIINKSKTDFRLMGVPAFFRWLSKRYPKSIANALTEDELEHLYEEYSSQGGAAKKGSDANEIDLGEDDLAEYRDPATRQAAIKRDMERKIRETNPEFDNLYLDMNGIIHPCTHPPGKDQPKTDIEMFNNIFEYVDKIMTIVRPQRLVYMAIDGVAPRAKMNQQRSRRFRGALEIEEQQAREQEIRNKWSKEGVKFTDAPLGKADSKFDKNVITPGTEFMWRLSKSLQYYVTERLHTDSLWKNVKVIFSDATIPGEGEHKILDFIRSQRCQPGYDPNTRHCIYGADADLIMLGLSTHEPHFCVLREAFIADFEKICTKCGEQGHLVMECPRNKEAREQAPKVKAAQAVQFQFIKLNVVREYLFLEFSDVQLPFPFDFERIIDDFVFFCFFVGNDFLPHLPSLHIREGAIDALMALYKYQLPSLGDYLTAGGLIAFDRVDLIFNDLAKIEEEFIRSKKAFDDRRKEQDARMKQQQQQLPSHVRLDQPTATGKSSQGEGNNGAEAETSPGTSESKVAKAVKELQGRQEELTEEQLNQLAAERMKEIIKKMQDERSQRRADNYVDKVQLGTEGWKLRYYQNKFHVSQQDLSEFLQKIKQAYLEGLQWVYSYYYQGCVSWTWFYPFHYAPFAGDLINSSSVDIKFEMGEPASPYEQLLGVFPKQSAHAIPLCYRYLLSDPNSEIIDFYPTNFHVDLNGAPYEWMGVVLLPFIDRHRLVKAMARADKGGQALTEHEKELNKKGDVLVFFEDHTESKSGLVQALTQVRSKEGAAVSSLELFASFQRADHLSGTVRVGPRSFHAHGVRVEAPYHRLELQQVEINRVYRFAFEHAGYERHLTQLLALLDHPVREVDDFEIHQVNRRFFNGERAIKMLEDKLGFESTISNISRGGGGYINNRAIHYDQMYQPPQKTTYQRGGGGAGQFRPRHEQQKDSERFLGKRPQRSYEEGGRSANSGGDQQESYHRSRYEHSQGGEYQRGGANSGARPDQQHTYRGRDGGNGGYSYNRGGGEQYRQQHQPQQHHSYGSQGGFYQQQQPQQQINYNLHSYNNNYHQQNQRPQGNPPPYNQYPAQQQQYQQHHSNPNYQSDQSILAQPQTSQGPSQLSNLLNQLNQHVNKQFHQQQSQQQSSSQSGQSQSKNRFQGFMER